MKLQKRTWVPLDYLDETLWQSLLDRYQFWRDASAYSDDGDLHKGLAYFVMIAQGQFAWPETMTPSPHPFDQVAIPRDVLDSNLLQSLLSQWTSAHESLYGPGRPIKCGFYCVAPGGHCGYHADGSVLDLGQRIDLSNPKEWDGIMQPQYTHRTVMPLRINKYDQFMIAGQPVRMTPGLVFEFSNTMPHAIFNRGDDYTVLLITTWAANADTLQHSLVNFQ